VSDGYIPPCALVGQGLGRRDLCLEGGRVLLLRFFFHLLLLREKGLVACKRVFSTSELPLATATASGVDRFRAPTPKQPAAGTDQSANVFLLAQEQQQQREDAAVLPVQEASRAQNPTLMAAPCAPSPPAAAVVVLFLLLLHFLVIGECTAAAAANVTFRPGDELRRYKRVQALLRRLNKPSLRTIQVRLLGSLYCNTRCPHSWCNSCLVCRRKFNGEIWLMAEPRRRRHRLRAGAPAAGVRPPEAAGTEATGKAFIRGQPSSCFFRARVLIQNPRQMIDQEALLLPILAGPAGAAERTPPPPQ
jgi:hypothetical protein